MTHVMDSTVLENPIINRFYSDMHHCVCASVCHSAQRVPMGTMAVIIIIFLLFPDVL